MKLEWDKVGERFYETGVDHGVLYLPNEAGIYNDGVAWNGLVTVNETPSGAEANAQYADNIKYVNLYSAEEFGATIEAFTYPDEFAPFDGLGVPTDGVIIGQQPRGSFGLSYRTRMGNDLEGDSYGYKLHLVYGCTATPSEKSYNTVNDSPEAITFSWEIQTVPVSVSGMRPTALVTIDSTKVDPAKLVDFENLLYGTEFQNPSLPLPDAVVTMFEGAALVVANPVAPTFSDGTSEVTIPIVTGLTYRIGGAVVTGDVFLEDGEVVLVEATLDAGYKFPETPYDKDWLFTGVST